MARKRAPKSPPHTAQREAADWPLKAKRSGMHIDDAETLATEVELLEGWVLRFHPAAQRIAPKGRGAPPKWERMLEALRWLRAHGVREVSDATGSRCIAVLSQFLDHTRPGRHHARRDGTAEQLAGTLRALADTIRRGQADTDPRGQV